MRTLTILIAKCQTLVSWAVSHRRYRLILVNPTTGGWVYLDTVDGHYYLVQSPFADPGTPLDLGDDGNHLRRKTYGNSSGWSTTQVDQQWYENLGQLATCAARQLSTLSST